MNKADFINLAKAHQVVEGQKPTLQFTEDGLLFFCSELLKRNSNSFIPFGDSNVCLIKNNEIYLAKYNQDNFTNIEAYMDYLKSLGYEIKDDKFDYIKESRDVFKINIVP